MLLIIYRIYGTVVFNICYSTQYLKFINKWTNYIVLTTGL